MTQVMGGELEPVFGDPIVGHAAGKTTVRHHLQLMHPFFKAATVIPQLPRN